MIGQGINSEVGGVGGKLALNANDSTAYRATNITGDTAEGLGNLVENVRGQVTKGIPQTDQLPTGKNGLRGYSKYLYGGDDKGQLEQYNTGLHKDMPDNFANAQLNGSPIQLQRKENIFS